MTIAWPSDLKTTGVLFHPQNVSRSGGPSLNGQEQTVSSGAGRWRARIIAPIRSDAARLAALSLIAEMEGRANEVLVPTFDYDGPTGTATLDAAASLRDTEIDIEMTSASGFLAKGNHFQIGERLYRVRELVGTAGTVQTVGFWPPLREDAADAASVVLQNPACLMKAANDDTGEIELDILRLADPVFEFVEAF